MYSDLRLALLAAGLAAGAAGCALSVRLDGVEPHFTRFAETRLLAPRPRCFEAASRVLQGSHGLERADEASGQLVSSRRTVRRYMEVTTSPLGAVGTEHTSDSQLFVTVDGDDARCRVVVTRMRVWQDLRELDAATRGWTRGQLETFSQNVVRELKASR